MKIETGVMVMKDGKAWGETYRDGQCTEYGWMDPESAPIHDPKFCKKTTDVTWNPAHGGYNPYMAELETAALVQVERRTEVIIRG